MYTVGHSTRPAEEFLALLQSAGIKCLADVRRFPGSRRYPQFNRERLSDDLGAAGIEYVHMPDLGGRREASGESNNLFWRNASFRAYADYMSAPEFGSALDLLQALARERAVAIMCAEALPWRCHRQLIADALTARGWQVDHVLAPGKVERHVLNSAAQVSAGGIVYYPPPTSSEKSRQSSLFE